MKKFTENSNLSGTMAGPSNKSIFPDPFGNIMRKSVVMAGVCAMVLSLTACTDNDFLLGSSDITRYMTLPQYKGIEVEVSPAKEVTEEDIDSKLLSDKKITIDNRAVKNGDTVNIAFEGKKDGVAFEGGTSESYDLKIGSGSFIEGFESGLIGVMPGETVDLDLTFPEDYGNADLAGADVVFTVTVHSITSNDISEVTDKIFKEQYPEYASLKEYRDEARADLEQQAEENYSSTIDNEITTKLLEITKFRRTPKILRDVYYNEMKQSYEMYAAMYGMNFNDFIKSFMGYTPDGFEEFLNQMADESAREVMIYQAIANAEGISPTEEELNTYLQEKADEQGSESVEEMLGENSDTESYRQELMREKVKTFLRENAVISAPADSADAEESAE